jgi:uncharacterized protein (DUF1800 family)
MPKALRRAAFPAVLALAAAAAIGLAMADGSNNEQKALHLLDRLGYGPRPGDLERVTAMGPERYIEEQLEPERIAQPPELRQRLAALDTAGLSAAELFRRYGPPARREAKDDEAARKQVQKAANRVAEQAMQARLLRAVYSPAQLQEVMTDFWFNHFNVFRGKGLEDRIWLGAYERDAIRPYALGRFRDLLGATAKHPAMLYYLDNWQSSVARTDLSGDSRGGLNENYARELMELHTLGVDGGYTQKDVTELARILTGWTYLPRLWEQGDDTPFTFEPRRHDFGGKTLLNRHLEGTGEGEGENALDLLARSPATAHHISWQLAQYFVADDPPPALVDRLAKSFQQSDGDIREVLRTLFHSPEFWSADHVGNKFKTPYQYVVSALRAYGGPIYNFRPAMGALNQLGMPLYGCLTPDGWKNTQAAWLNPDAMVYRLNFATALGAGRLPLLRDENNLPTEDPAEGPPPPLARAAGEGGTARGAGGGERERPRQRSLPDEGEQAPKPMNVSISQPTAEPEFGPDDRRPPPDADALQATLGNPFSPQTASAIAAARPQLHAALMLGSPEFMRH